MRPIRALAAALSVLPGLALAQAPSGAIAPAPSGAVVETVNRAERSVLLSGEGWLATLRAPRWTPELAQLRPGEAIAAGAARTPLSVMETTGGTGAMAGTAPDGRRTEISRLSVPSGGLGGLGAEEKLQVLMLRFGPPAAEGGGPAR